MSRASPEDRVYPRSRGGTGHIGDPRPAAVYPRSRGGNRDDAGRGSIPSRGGPGSARSRMEGSIPARAGEPSPWFTEPSTSVWVYPRSRGGTGDAVGLMSTVLRGVYPRSRGGTMIHARLARKDERGSIPARAGVYPLRSIPARAGEPEPRHATPRRSNRVYPRSRGGTSYFSCNSDEPGLSPLARGNHQPRLAWHCSKSGLSPLARGNRRRIRLVR